MSSPPVGFAPPRPRPDPRMRERWVQVQRQRGRRRLRVLVGGATAVALAAVAFGALHSPLLAVRHLKVTGGAGLSGAMVEAAARVHSDTPLIDVSPAVADRRIEALSVVATATVARSWPDTLRVRIVERVPVAQIAHPVPGEPNAVLLVDSSGRVTSASASPSPGLILLSGVGLPTSASQPLGSWLVGSAGSGAEPGTPRSLPAADPSSALASPGGLVDAALLLSAALPAGIRARTGSIEVEAGALVLQLAGGPPVLLGGPTQLPAKLAALSTLLAEANLVGAQRIDLTAPQRPAVAFAGGGGPAGNVDQGSSTR